MQQTGVPGTASMLPSSHPSIHPSPRLLESLPNKDQKTAAPPAQSSPPLPDPKRPHQAFSWCHQLISVTLIEHSGGCHLQGHGVTVKGNADEGRCPRTSWSLVERQGLDGREEGMSLTPSPPSHACGRVTASTLLYPQVQGSPGTTAPGHVPMSQEGGRATWGGPSSKCAAPSPRLPSRCLPSQSLISFQGRLAPGYTSQNGPSPRPLPAGHLEHRAGHSGMAAPHSPLKKHLIACPSPLEPTLQLHAGKNAGCPRSAPSRCP